MATTKITNPDLFDLGSLNTALKLPSGTTAERPTSPSTGEWRYNTTTNLVEFWDGGAWRDLQSEEIPPVPSENFNTVLYSGTGSTQSITGVGFKPDWVWIKRRDGAENHYLQDSSRGSTQQIYSNLTNAQFNETTAVTSFDSDGFTMGSYNGINNSGETYVAWCWKANGGTTSSNTDGTNITSTVQVNAKAGFSIVQFTTPGTFNGSNTVGHGLGSTPDAIFVKRTDGVEDWYVYHQAAGLNKASRLNSTINYTNATYLFGTVNSTVFNPNYTSATSLVNIAYCFKSIAGYSKFGSYTGNGTTQVVNTGFKPGWIMIKSTAGNDNWRLYDTARGITAGGFLEPNRSDADDTSNAPNINILSNGFEITAGGTTVGNNVNGNLYTYYAFASDQSAAPVLADSFANKLYNGTGNELTVSGLGFQPSMSWLKTRNAANEWNLYDNVRGPFNKIKSNTTSAQEITGALSGFYIDGFTLRGSGYSLNQAGQNNISYNWKASPVPTINTDGTIQSVVSANQASGFSIVGWTGDGSASATVGHGLSGTPDFIMLKDLTDVGGWNGAQVGLASNEGIGLQSSAAAFTGMGGNGGITYANLSATNFGFATGSSGVDSVNKNGNQYIAYCWKSVAGFSKMASYSGTGSSNPITGLGFSPNWVMIKSSTSVENWAIFDTSRGSNVLYANTDSAESAFSTFTFDSDGFTVPAASGMTNGSGQTYIYMAYKENPVQYAIPSGQMGYLVAAGGGGSGADSGGGAGAGAGGLRTTYGLTSGGGASAETNLTLATGTYTITVGAGGAAYDGVTTAQNGVASTITGVASVSTVGGGAAGDFLKSGTAYKGNDGGSGGGSANSNGALTLAGGAGTANEGFAGGAGSTAGGPGSDSLAAGGGGGSAQVGTAGALNTGGNGGNGLTVAITGSSAGYAGGGGGGCRGTSGTTAGQGGNGGGGDAVSTGNGNPGTANTGGGAGGGRSAGANGGSGVVILRLNTSDYSGATTGSPTVTTNGSETILTYTGSGTYVHS